MKQLTAKNKELRFLNQCQNGRKQGSIAFMTHSASMLRILKQHYDKRN